MSDTLRSVVTGICGFLYFLMLVVTLGGLAYIGTSEPYEEFVKACQERNGEAVKGVSGLICVSNTFVIEVKP